MVYSKSKEETSKSSEQQGLEVLVQEKKLK